MTGNNSAIIDSATSGFAGTLCASFGWAEKKERPAQKRKFRDLLNMNNKPFRYYRYGVINWHLLLSLVVLFSFESFAITLKAEYVPIDSISEYSPGARVNIDLKGKVLNFDKNGFKIKFKQTTEINSEKYFTSQHLESTEKDSYNLRIKELVHISTDSVFITVGLYQVEKRIMGNEKIGIPKSDLNGLVLGPTKRSSLYLLSFLMGIALIGGFLSLRYGN